MSKRVIITVTELPPAHFDSFEDLKAYNERHCKKPAEVGSWPFLEERTKSLKRKRRRKAPATGDASEVGKDSR